MRVPMARRCAPGCSPQGTRGKLELGLPFLRAEAATAKLDPGEELHALIIDLLDPDPDGGNIEALTVKLIAAWRGRSKIRHIGMRLIKGFEISSQFDCCLTRGNMTQEGFMTPHYRTIMYAAGGPYYQGEPITLAEAQVMLNTDIAEGKAEVGSFLKIDQELLILEPPDAEP
jgi:hypothetical protein